MARTKQKTKFKPSRSLLSLQSPSSMAQATQPPSTSNPPSIHCPWGEKDELSLLTAILEIAKEPAESYNPRINLYDRIAKILNKTSSNKEILGKVKELRTRYEKKCFLIRNRNQVKRTAAFEMSEKVWGVEMQKGEDKPPKKKKAKGKNPAQSNKTLQEIEHKASKPELKRPHEPTKGGDDVRPKKKKKRGKKQERDKTACFNCRKPGHFSHECTEEKKIEKQSGEQQETKEISKDAAGLQVKTESKGEEQSSTLVSASNKTLQEIEHKASKPELKRPHEPTNGVDDVPHEPTNGVDDVPPKKGKKQETDKTACFNCRKPGHFTHECTEEKKIEKQSGDQQETKEISKDVAGLQVKTESKGEEQSSTLVSASVQPGSHQLKPQKTQHIAKVPNSPHHDQKRVNVFQPGAYRPEQSNVFNRFLSNGRQLFPQHWNTGPAPPLNVPQPPAWGPRTPIPPTPYPPPPMPYRYPPPPMPYRYPPPYPMNYSLPPNYPPMFNNANPPPNFIPLPAQNSPRFAPQR